MSKQRCCCSLRTELHQGGARWPSAVPSLRPPHELPADGRLLRWRLLDGADRRVPLQSGRQRLSHLSHRLESHATGIKNLDPMEVVEEESVDEMALSTQHAAERDKKSAQEKAQAKEFMKPVVKGDYLPRVHVVEARDWSYASRPGTMRSCDEVEWKRGEAAGRKAHTSTKQKTSSPLFDEQLFISAPLMDEQKMSDSEITIAVYNAEYDQRARPIGQYTDRAERVFPSRP